MASVGYLLLYWGQVERLKGNSTPDELEAVRELRNDLCHGLESAEAPPSGVEPRLICRRLDGRRVTYSWSDLRNAIRALDAFLARACADPAAGGAPACQLAAVASRPAAPTPAAPPKQRPRKAAPLIAGVLAELAPTADGWASVGLVGRRLRNRYPDFDQRTYGHAKLSDLIRATGRFEVAPDGSGVLRARPKG